ncbi:LysE family translocator [Paludibacteraceae bacterium OttesenSCG-928-F17]|nr:LysE family translocator [Paludibacteraceae bacterium OttesenSCG-928-F17]
MLDLIIKGIIIGLCISVPLGPIGMLCIQRTLNRGRKYGIATGLGATTSDLVYTIITLFFLRFIIGFIDEHRMIVQIIGAAIVIVFGYFIFKSRPSTQPQAHDTSKHSLFSDFITSFGLTFSNPFILFVLIALFARFTFIQENSTLATYIIGIGSILTGAFLWWLLLTYIVSHFRNKLNLRGLRLINLITGCVIMVIGCVGLIMGIINN